MAHGMGFESLKPHLLPVHSLCFDVRSTSKRLLGPQISKETRNVKHTG